MKSLEETWRTLQNQMDSHTASDKEMAAWESQFGSQFVDGDGGLADPAFDVDQLLHEPKPFEYSSDQATNPYKDHEDPFAEGQRLLAAGAPLGQVELAFEEACRRDENRAEAWAALGDAFAADEKELQAIRALERAVGASGPNGKSAWLVSSALALISEQGKADARACGNRAWLYRTSMRDRTFER